MPFYDPKPAGEKRLRRSRRLRTRAAQLAEARPVVQNPGASPFTQTNGEEQHYSDSLITSFTKGLPRTPFGTAVPEVYEAFVAAINARTDSSAAGSQFDLTVSLGPANAVGANVVTGQHGAQSDFASELMDAGTHPAEPVVRNWESPRSGHAYDLEGPDAEALCMPPAPRLDSDELAVEMAELYAMTLFRDAPFPSIEDGSASSAQGKLTTAELVDELRSMEWFQRSHLPAGEQRRRDARGLTTTAGPDALFRGSAPGAKQGPYFSQFLLQGTQSGSRPAADGLISYGVQTIDQRLRVHRQDLDYMTEWYAWLDVQNGIDMKNGLVAGTRQRITVDQYESQPRFLLTPRDLATYVHFDQLYQAYLNACLMMLESGVPFAAGFPAGTPSDVTRGSFATFGGPHVLALLTEVSSRALRAVRRQKFNYHRRGRPEAMGLALTLAAGTTDAREALGAALPSSDLLLAKLPGKLMKAVRKRIDYLNGPLQQAARWIRPKAPQTPPAWLQQNYLLPMAFPEGSPMHPA